MLFDDNDARPIQGRLEAVLRGIGDAFLVVILISIGVCAGNLASVSIDDWRNGVVPAEYRG